MKIRRSNKSDKSQDLKTHHISIPQKDAIAIVPPKKVIKALYDYKAPSTHDNEQYLSFAQGDFLHVVAREDDPDWYEACNPLHGSRGLVPVNYFELVGKQVRNSAGLEPAGLQQAGTGHDSGYAENSMGRTSLNGADQNGVRPGRASMGRNNGAMVYGIVQYDFKAERPDELDAKAGEAIIVIAQSNPEWFVAKPITRLGGPGLIPVSFIEIRDMNTGRAVQDSHDAVRRAGVPKVEEWKKMAADYKNSSIPLGRLEMSGMQGLQQGVERMSVGNTSTVNGSPQDQARMNHQRNGSSYTATSPFQSQQYHSAQLLSPVQARVPRYSPLWRGDWWFNVEVTMEDGKSWELFRTYRDFYSLQLNLIEQFPEAAGKVEGIKRTLPFMPGPLPSVTEQLTGKRRNHLDKYLANLLIITRDITNSIPVKSFFHPRPSDGDHEIDPTSLANHDRLSGISQDSRQMEDPRQSSTGNLSGTGSAFSSPQRQQPQQQQQYRPSSPYGQQNPPQMHYRNPSELRAPPPMLRNNSAMTQASATSQSTTFSTGGQSAGTATTATNAMSTTKVKVWFGETNCVMIRLDPAFGYVELVQKLKDRWSMEPGADKSNTRDARFIVEYKDDSTRSFYRIENDDDLSEAKRRCDKLTLRVEAGEGMM